MFASLARNIVITGIAYSVISVVGLVLAPFLIGLYGLGGYGQILLARFLLPSASFGFLDLGIGETATRTIGVSRENGDWDHAASVLSLLCGMALSISAVTALLMIATAHLLPGWMSIAPGQSAGFTNVILLTAALQPVLFLSLVFEGVLKGFERFRRLRLCEISSSAVYATLAVSFGLGGWGPNWVSVALLAGLTVRFVIVFLSALPLLRAAGVRLRGWTRETRGDVLHWSLVMLANKTLGTLQTQAASPLIGLMLGPPAVGAFDAVVRLPRFAKSVFSLLSSTVLPVSAALKARADANALRLLGSYGILAALTISLPPMLFAMAYSHSFLKYWIGSAVVGFWGWQSAMFLVSMLNVAISFGGAILLADRDASSTLNRLTFWQVAIQLVLSVALVPFFAQWAFVVGQVVSVILLFPLQFAAVRRALGLGPDLLRQFLLLVATAGVIALGLRLIIPNPSPVILLLLGMVSVGLAWAVFPWVLLRDGERRALFDRLRARLGRAPASAETFPYPGTVDMLYEAPIKEGPKGPGHKG